MTRRRLRDAVTAVTGGLLLAVDHLRGDTPQMESVAVPPPGIVNHPCPSCGCTLDHGPHLHDDAVIWPTADDDIVLVTKLDGTDPIEIGGDQ